MLNLALHVGTGNLVAWQGAAAVLPDFRQGQVPVRIRFVDDNPNYPANGLPYQAADLTDYPDIRIGLWTRSKFTDGTSEASLLAIAHSVATQGPNLTYNDDDASDPYFEGDWDLATDAIGDLAGNSKDVWFTVALVYTGGTIYPLIDGNGAPNAKLYAASDDGLIAAASSAPVTGARIKLPCTFEADDGTGRVWELNILAGTDQLNFVRIV